MSWNTDLGWRYYGDAISASADLYHSNYFNKQEVGYDPVNNDEIYTTIPHMDMQGFNGEISWKLAQYWTVYSSYTYTQAKIRGDLDGGPYDSNNGKGPGIYLTDDKTMPDTPRNMGNLSLSYDNTRYWASLNARSTSSLYGDYMNTETVGGFTTFNFSAGWRFDDWNSFLTKPYLKLNVGNLLDHHAFSYVSSAALLSSSTVGKELNLYNSTAYYGLLQPRSYMLTFGVSFR
jgi:iron complex outermembrane recepter protein